MFRYCLHSCSLGLVCNRKRRFGRRDGWCHFRLEFLMMEPLMTCLVVTMEL